MKKKVSASSNLFSIIIIFFFLIVEQSTIWCLAENNNVTFGCVPSERKALLRFRASLFDPSNRLSSWNTSYDDDCCTWEGVECDKATGHVTGLHLRNRHVEIIYDDYDYGLEDGDHYPNQGSMLRSKTIDSSSLLELKHLSYLDLSCNDFQQSSIPASLGSMKQLQHLNLSNANFSGIVPPQLGNLSSLHTLDLNSIDDGLINLFVDNDLMWVSNLSSLEYLGLSHIFIGTDLIKVLSMLPSIVELQLSNTDLFDTNLPHTCLNSTLLANNNVQHLDLSINSLEGEFPCFLHNMSSLKFLDLSNNNYNSSDPSRTFIRLKYLSHLNLGGNPLINNNAADWIYDLLRDKCHLKLLNLRDCNHYGDLISISGAFKNLSGCWIKSLESLDLNGNGLYGQLPEELGELKQLQELSLGYNKFSGPIPSSLGNLRALRVLRLSENQLSGEIPISIGQLLNLERISISNNEFNGHLPEDLGELQHLKWLYVYANEISGPIPASLGNLTTLRVLGLSGNQLSGEIPISIGQLLNLESISISYNEFNGHLPASLGNLTNLRVLDLSVNQLSGEIPISIGQLSNVEKIHIYDNKISGAIPASLGNLTTLRDLDLSGNQLNGEVPITLRKLSNLEGISISMNSLEGTLSEAHFTNLSKLERLGVEYNMLEIKVGHDWVPPFQLRYLWIRSTSLGAQFPQWLRTQKALTGFDLSNCRITGMLPKWLKSMSLEVLYLPENHIEGPIPELPSSLSMLDLSDNMITNHFQSNTMPLNLGYLSLARNFISGSIPDLLCQMKALRTLDLSGNQLSGIVPDCWGNFESLDVVRLSSNQLSGAIPNSIGGAYSLRWLHLNNNNFIGQIPSTLKNCTLLLVLDVGDNKFSGKLPQWIGDHLLNLVVLRLRNNEFYGTIPSTYCKPSRLQVMDLANNNLTGNIPRCFGNFTGMVEGGSINETFGVDGGWFYEHLNQVMKGQTLEFTKTTTYVVNLDLSCNHLSGEIPSELTNLTGLIGLNLSHNHLGGKIPRNVGGMNSLESLDLSCNTLSGTIPQSLSKLNFITHLDLSNNNLSGQIPTGPQLQTLDNTSNYGGNPGLCGLPLQKKCHIKETPPKVQNDAEDGDRTDKIYMYAFIISGLATGFWGYFGVLVFKKSWRLALFQYMDVVIGKVLGQY